MKLSRARSIVWDFRLPEKAKPRALARHVHCSCLGQIRNGSECQCYVNGDPEFYEALGISGGDVDKIGC
jgi:hypothetical protein